MRYIDDGFIEYEVQQAKAKREQVAESLESVRYLTEIRDEHERLNDPAGVAHYDSAINLHLEFIREAS
tara:strand:+ start:282 stop:485 length:204 start_codon:yes stop_codon:yes gene_type:complete